MWMSGLEVMGDVEVAGLGGFVVIRAADRGGVGQLHCGGWSGADW